jgi:hypothetical protein
LKSFLLPSGKAWILAAIMALVSCVESSSYTPLPPSIPAARLPMNDAYLGSVHAGPLRPLFRWEPSTAQASGTISYELQTESPMLRLALTVMLPTQGG